MKTKLLKAGPLLACLLLLIVPEGMAQPPSVGKLRLLFWGRSINQQPWAAKVAAQFKAGYHGLEFEARNPVVAALTLPTLTAPPSRALHSLALTLSGGVGAFRVLYLSRPEECLRSVR